MTLPDQFTLSAGGVAYVLEWHAAQQAYYPAARLLPYAEPETPALDANWLLTDRTPGGAVVDGAGHFDDRGAAPAAFRVDVGNSWFADVPEPYAVALLAPLAVIGRRRGRRPARTAIRPRSTLPVASGR